MAREPIGGVNDLCRESHSPGLCFGESIVRGSPIFQRLRVIPQLCDSTRTPTPPTKKEKLNLSCMHSLKGRQRIKCIFEEHFMRWDSCEQIRHSGDGCRLSGVCDMWYQLCIAVLNSPNEQNLYQLTVGSLDRV